MIQRGDTIESTEPLFSIITVCLNSGAKLLTTAESVGIQEFRDFEYIIKDGGSTDGSLKCLTADPQTRCIIQQDHGIYDAMNQALAIARGKYVLFMNAGDKLFNRRVLLEVAKAISENERISLIYGDAYRAKESMLMANPKLLRDFRLYRKPLIHQCYFVKREVIEQIGGFDLSLPICADYDMLVKLLIGQRRTSLYCGSTICSYEGGGYTEKPEIFGKMSKEFKKIRSRHFPLWERLLFKVLWHATLPGIRGYFLRSGNFPVLRRLYLNTIYTKSDVE